MFLAQAEEVRRLFATDTQTRNAFGGVPYTNDILSEIINTARYNSGALTLTRPRVRLGQTLTTPDGEVVAYAGISVVQNAKATTHESQFVWGIKDLNPINGVFIRRIITKNSERGKGYGALLLSQIRTLAQDLHLHIYCDTKAGNVEMRRFLRRESARENIFWHTKNGTLMVRYMWM